ncbi:diguanylate cyclase [Paenibacillus algicola]|uniref:Diguanylate cyclase n=1 Tax=Paenibacillus algicola TaxID=2565926 RepID=A0A4P8XG67_9BACL|nr:MASE4 domain-containing protein [Paenibacillus algicola]QCT01198.1 diguanylate cyclase [Paenibacillus algicola]
MLEITRESHQLLHIPSGSTQKRVAIWVALSIFVVSLLVLPFGSRMLIEIKPFLPGFISWFVLGDFLTSYLLFSQFRATRSLPLLVLSCTYLYTALITIPHILTFPGVFSETGLIGAGDQSAVWLWVLWHGGFPIGILLYLWSGRKSASPVAVKRIKTAGLIAVLLVLGIVFLLYLLVTLGNDMLPRIIQKGNFRVLLESGIGPVVWGLNLVALLLLLWVHRGRSVLHLWLSVAVFAFLMDVTLTLYSGARYSLGWYAARTNSLISATVVICSLMYEVNKLYVRLIRNREQLLRSRMRLEEANERLTRLSEVDGLTGIPNRRAFDEKLDKAVQASKAEGTPLSVLLIDVDHFKAYNDHYGHLRGDHALKRVAWALMETSITFPHTTAYRYGGEEFAVIMEKGDSEQAAIFGEHARKAVVSLGLPHEQSRTSSLLSISVGLHSRVLEEQDTGDGLLEQADQALYRAKESGRNRVAKAEDGLMHVYDQKTS